MPEHPIPSSFRPLLLINVVAIVFFYEKIRNIRIIYGQLGVTAHVRRAFPPENLLRTFPWPGSTSLLSWIAAASPQVPLLPLVPRSKDPMQDRRKRAHIEAVFDHFGALLCLLPFISPPGSPIARVGRHPPFRL